MIKMEYLEEMIEQFINNNLVVKKDGDDDDYKSKFQEKDLLILKMIE